MLILFVKDCGGLDPLADRFAFFGIEAFFILVLEFNEDFCDAVLEVAEVGVELAEGGIAAFENGGDLSAHRSGLSLADDIAGVFKGEFRDNPGRGGLVEQDLRPHRLTSKEGDTDESKDEEAEEEGFKDLTGIKLELAVFAFAKAARLFFAALLGGVV